MNRKTVLKKGDVVTINPGRTIGRNGGPFDLIVSEVVERHALNRESGQFVNHLVSGHRVDNGVQEWFDFGYISKIKSRAPSPKLTLPENIFRGFDFEENPLIRYKNKTTGTPFSLIVYALGKLPYRLTRKIDERRAFALFNKQKPGLIEVGWRVTTVNDAVFCRWVRKNYHKLLQTKKELVAKETRQYEQDHAQMRADMEYMDAQDSGSYDWLSDKIFQ